MLLPDLHISFSRGRSGGLVFPSLSEFSTVYYNPAVKGSGIVNKAEIVVKMDHFVPIDFEFAVFVEISSYSGRGCICVC